MATEITRAATRRNTQNNVKFMINSHIVALPVMRKGNRSCDAFVIRHKIEEKQLILALPLMQLIFGFM